MKFIKKWVKRIVWTGVAVVVIAGAGAGYYFYGKTDKVTTSEAVKSTYKTVYESDKYVRFDMEIFDSIKKNYWQKASDGDLSTLFTQAVQKATASSTLSPFMGDREHTAEMLAKAFTIATSTESKKQLSILIGQIALYNVAPLGRSGLLSKGEETQLRNTVANIHPEEDPYATIGAAKASTSAEIKLAYEAKKDALKNATTSEAKAELEKVNKAYGVLSNVTNKTLYDTTKMQPSIFMHKDGKHTLYIDMSQVTPASFGEFVQKLIEEVNRDPSLSYMILDLRHNIGGSLDFANYFMALFQGPKQYSYDLFHQGDYQVVRTPEQVPKLEQIGRMKEIAILTDNMTQSTAELTTAIFKKFNMAKVVGTATRGWGTVENTFPLETTLEASTTYTVLMVHSITLRDDGQPIEGRGVDPHVNIKDKNWKEQLLEFFKAQDLIDAIIKEMGKGK